MRHAERTKILIHLIDISGAEGRDPLNDYEKINHEIREYSDRLFFKDRIVVANKIDAPEASGHLKRFKKKYQEKILAVSALNKTGLEELLKFVRSILCRENSRVRSSV